MDIKDLFMDICMDLWAGDCKISLDLFKRTINERIDNLRSSIGPEAHKKLQELGIIDETGLTWEEQDKYSRQQIKAYIDLLDYINNDNNWTP